RSQTWLSRRIARCSDKVSAIFARPAASEIVVKQFPSLVKAMPALRAWQATYSWPFKIAWAGKGGCPLILMVRWPQPSRGCETKVVDIRHRLLSFDVVFCADIPHRRLRPTDQNQAL